MKQVAMGPPGDATAPATPRDEPKIVVLDTNVVLDWLVFDAPRTRPIAAAVADGRVHWLTTAAILAEQRHVFAGFVTSRWRARAEALDEACSRWATVVDAPLVVRPPRCSDTDDQVFVDLALGRGASWLVTHDRALLKLARRMRASGCEVLTPTAWATAAAA